MRDNSIIFTEMEEHSVINNCRFTISGNLPNGIWLALGSQFFTDQVAGILPLLFVQDSCNIYRQQLKDKVIFK